MELNIATLIAPTLTAPTLAAPADLLSLLQTPEAAPAASTDSSAGIPQDFSALLTEMIGPVQAAAVPAVPGVPAIEKPHEIAKPAKVEDVQLSAQLPPAVVVPFVPLAVLAITDEGGLKPAPTSASTDTAKPENEHVGAGFTPVATQPTPELERAFAEIRKFEVTVQAEAPAKLDAKPLPVAPAPAQEEKAQPLAIVTTDAIETVKQQQLPPRVIPIQKIVIDTKLPERAKTAATPSSSETTTTTTTPVHFSDSAQTVQPVEQARAAHTVEIPNTPKLQVVRTVAMQVGDNDSQVTIRIQERGGDMVMHLQTGSEPLRQDLQESVGTLMHALKQEQIQVSNVEVSKKPPIDKVRRMKEAR